MVSTVRQVKVTDFHTKGAVLLACFQCVDTLVLALKHAEGMSLRCDVICAIAYCGRHESSHIIKAHTDLTRFKKKMVCGNLWKFVVLKPSHKLAQIFTNYLWAKWSVSQ